MLLEVFSSHNMLNMGYYLKKHVANNIYLIEHVARSIKLIEHVARSY